MLSLVRRGVNPELFFTQESKTVSPENWFHSLQSTVPIHLWVSETIAVQKEHIFIDVVLNDFAERFRSAKYQ